MNITFIGAGYVGLGTGIMMSELGHNVTCIDTNPSKIAQLRAGTLPIFEPGLDKYLTKNIKEGRLKFKNCYSRELSTAAAIFVTVWTPSKANGEADLSYLFAAVNCLIPYISKDCLIIIKSTVPPGTCQQLADNLAAQNLNYDIAANPEFLREGMAIADFLQPARIVVGTKSARARKALAAIYAPLIAKGVPVINTDPTTAELIKYAANAYLATKLALINEMANLCEHIKADIEQLTLAIGLDKRIGKDFLKVGPGFGGSCFPKDTKALLTLAKNYHTDFQVLDAVISSNNKRPALMIEKIERITGNLAGLNITVLGLTFKANTDDIRSSPAIAMIELLISKGANICAYDPAGMDNAREILKVKFASSASAACLLADAIVITTEWEEFKQLNFATIYHQLKKPVIIDLRNILSRSAIKKIGFKYYSIG